MALPWAITFRPCGAAAANRRDSQVLARIFGILGRVCGADLTFASCDLGLPLKGGACGRPFGEALSMGVAAFPAVVSVPIFRPFLGGLPATVARCCYALRSLRRRCLMYCAKCRRQLYYKDPNHHGWCFTCGEVVDITNCKVSHWNIIAVFIMFWTLQV